MLFLCPIVPVIYVKKCLCLIVLVIYICIWVSPKKVLLEAPGEKLYLFCATLLYGVFNIFS